MSTTIVSPKTQASPSSATSKIARVVIALLAALAVTYGANSTAFAATGAQTGEWDIVAASKAQAPRLQSYNHTVEAWDTVTSPTAWFAVGSGKVIDENELASTPVKGGGIRFVNTATTAKTATFTFTVPANVGLVIQNGTQTIVNSPATGSGRTVSWTTPSVVAGATFHNHFTWTFSGSGTETQADIQVQVSVPGAGSYAASSTYRFTF
ncbi:hypothetical protein AB0O52_04555 [Arthrobacter sp. NPDC080073]|uniref:hypothetical protein n=1 Tax=Arthrobacter sp. NPDC080073 TaxID=3155919 RepID=UPI0034471BE5